MRLFHCTWKAVLGRRLASPICAFHLGISLDIIDEEQDSIRFYKLPEGRDKRVEEYGQSNVVDFTGPLLA